MENVITGVSSLLSLSGTMITTITENPILCAMFSAGFVSIAAGVVHKLKKV